MQLHNIAMVLQNQPPFVLFSFYNICTVLKQIMSCIPSCKKPVLFRGLVFLLIVSVINQLGFRFTSSRFSQQKPASPTVTINRETKVSFENSSVTKTPPMIDFNQTLTELKKRNIDAWSIVRSSWKETKQTIANSPTLK